MNLLFLDTETTDIKDNFFIVQLAYINRETGKEVNEYFKPPVPISFGSMAIHHITEEMVADKPAFQGSKQQEKLQSDLEGSLIVAHNAAFDVGVLKREKITTGKYIDTLQVARHLLKSEQYRLQFLRYSLNLKVEGAAHDALTDIRILKKLYEHLEEALKKKENLTDDETVIKYMIELTHTPVLIETFRFGKHKGTPFAEVYKNDPGYLEWLYDSETSKPENEQSKDLVHTLKHYLGAK